MIPSTNNNRVALVVIPVLATPVLSAIAGKLLSKADVAQHYEENPSKIFTGVTVFVSCCIAYGGAHLAQLSSTASVVSIVACALIGLKARTLSFSRYRADKLNALKNAPDAFEAMKQAIDWGNDAACSVWDINNNIRELSQKQLETLSQIAADKKMKRLVLSFAMGHRVPTQKQLKNVYSLHSMKEIGQVFIHHRRNSSDSKSFVSFCLKAYDALPNSIFKQAAIDCEDRKLLTFLQAYGAFDDKDDVLTLVGCLYKMYESACEDLTEQEKRKEEMLNYTDYQVCFKKFASHVKKRIEVFTGQLPHQKENEALLENLSRMSLQNPELALRAYAAQNETQNPALLKAMRSYTNSPAATPDNPPVGRSSARELSEKVKQFTMGKENQKPDSEEVSFIKLLKQLGLLKADGSVTNNPFVCTSFEDLR